ncbi:MAG: hypothetical protein ACOC80_00675 [Petrotogales bacterium]
MKYFNMTVFIFCIHIAGTLVNLMGIYDINTFQPRDSWIDGVKTDEIKDMKYVQTQVESSSSGFDSLIDTAKSIFYFVTAIALGSLMLPYTIWQMGVPWQIASLVALPIGLLYLIGLAQWIGNRNAQGMA